MWIHKDIFSEYFSPFFQLFAQFMMCALAEAATAAVVVQCLAGLDDVSLTQMLK